MLYAAKKYLPNLYDAVITRAILISEITTDTDNTFFPRLDNIIAGSDVFSSPVILIGFG